MTRPLVDPLSGPLPTWRMAEELEPVYALTLRDLGQPGLDTPARPAVVLISGAVVNR